MEKSLDRFLEAQATTYEQALAEIRSGRKISHWMWYIFPQYKGLGSSDTSKYYSIKDINEAYSYLSHSVLGDRLKHISKELLLLSETNPTTIFGYPDDIKLKSCMTLFSFIDLTKEQVFRKVLDKYFNGKYDMKTLSLIKNE